MQRVLVTQSYFLNFDPKVKDAGQPSPPLGSLICAAVLRGRGFDVHFLDAMLASSEQDCAVRLDEVKPDALIIFEDSFNYLTKMCLGRMREAAVRMIGMARERDVPVIVAGSDASDDPMFFLNAGASAVAKGEGEFAVAEWLENRAASPRSIAGIVALGSAGDAVVGPARIPVRDLDALPSPAWDLIDVPAYRAIWMARHDRFALPVATSRGCPFHCNWCAKPIWGQRYNTISPARAAREMLTLKQLGATQVKVLDDIFGLKPGWLDEFAGEVESRGASLPFECLSRADLLNDRTVMALSKTGCRMVWIGAESGSQKILDAMEKGTTVEEIRRASARLRGVGIQVGFFLQFGYPGETDIDVRATIDLVCSELPDDIGISVSYPLPGTRFHDRVKAEMSSQTHWKDSSDLAVLFTSRHDTAHYRILHSYVHARFRFAQALRPSRHSLVRRALRGVRFGAASLVHGARLALARSPSSTSRPFAPELSRASAATPVMPVS